MNNFFYFRNYLTRCSYCVEINTLIKKMYKKMYFLPLNPDISVTVYQTCS